MLVGCGSSLFPYCSSVNLKTNTNLRYQDTGGAEQAPFQQSLTAGIALTNSFEEPLVLTFWFEPRIAFQPCEESFASPKLDCIWNLSQNSEDWVYMHIVWLLNVFIKGRNLNTS